MNKCNKIFENIILILILASSLIIALDHPLLNPEATFTLVIRRLDDALTFQFLLEALIRIIALGFVHSTLK